MGSNEKQTYRIGNTTFIVAPVYQTGRGKTIISILLKLMKADAQSA